MASAPAASSSNTNGSVAESMSIRQTGLAPSASMAFGPMSSEPPSLGLRASVRADGRVDPEAKGDVVDGQRMDVGESQRVGHASDCVAVRNGNGERCPSGSRSLGTVDRRGLRGCPWQ